MSDKPRFPCDYEHCGGALQYEETVVQEGTLRKAYKLRCDKNPAHRYFVMEGREPNKHNRLQSDQRWAESKRYRGPGNPRYDPHKR